MDVHSRALNPIRNLERYCAVDTYIIHPSAHGTLRSIPHLPKNLMSTSIAFVTSGTSFLPTCSRNRFQLVTKSQGRVLTYRAGTVWKLQIRPKSSLRSLCYYKDIGRSPMSASVHLSFMNNRQYQSDYEYIASGFIQALPFKTKPDSNNQAGCGSYISRSASRPDSWTRKLIDSLYNSK